MTVPTIFHTFVLKMVGNSSSPCLSRVHRGCSVGPPEMQKGILYQRPRHVERCYTWLRTCAAVHTNIHDPVTTARGFKT